MSKYDVKPPLEKFLPVYLEDETHWWRIDPDMHEVYFKELLQTVQAQKETIDRLSDPTVTTVCAFEAGEEEARSRFEALYRSAKAFLDCGICQRAREYSSCIHWRDFEAAVRRIPRVGG